MTRQKNREPRRVLRCGRDDRPASNRCRCPKDWTELLAQQEKALRKTRLLAPKAQSELAQFESQPKPDEASEKDAPVGDAATGDESASNGSQKIDPEAIKAGFQYAIEHAPTAVREMESAVKQISRRDREQAAVHAEEARRILQEIQDAQPKKPKQDQQQNQDEQQEKKEGEQKNEDKQDSKDENEKKNETEKDKKEDKKSEEEGEKDKDKKDEQRQEKRFLKIASKKHCGEFENANNKSGRETESLRPVSWSVYLWTRIGNDQKNKPPNESISNPTCSRFSLREFSHLDDGCGTKCLKGTKSTSHYPFIIREGEAPAEPLRRRLGRSLALPNDLRRRGITTSLGTLILRCHLLFVCDWHRALRRAA